MFSNISSPPPIIDTELSWTGHQDISENVRQISVFIEVENWSFRIQPELSPNIEIPVKRTIVLSYYVFLS